MPYQVYQGLFSDWSDVADEFDIVFEEPDRVFLADYDGSHFEGSALVVYRDRGGYFLVEAAHCSQMRLEGQFEPTAYESAAELIGCLRRAAKTCHMGARAVNLCNALASDAAALAGRKKKAA